MVCQLKTDCARLQRTSGLCFPPQMPHLLHPHRFVPDTVEDVPIRVNPQHDVLIGSVVDKGTFGVYEEDIRNPDLLHQPGVERPALVVVRWKRQPLVLPVMTQIQSHGEVLNDTEVSVNFQLHFLPPVCDKSTRSY